MTDAKKELSADEILQMEDPYFELQAFVGTTKHMGGLKATDELVELCRIGKDSYVLDVGCGAGATPAYLAKQHGCRVVGVDIRDEMVDLAKGRARREGVQDTVELKVADARQLSFEDAVFDAVLVESVTSFIQDKARVIAECARVAKPGGYVGLNEDTWLKARPPEELVEYAALTWGGTTPETASGWKQLLEGAGLQDIAVRTFEIKVGRESSQIQRYGMSDMLRMGVRSLRLYFKPAFRKYMKERLAMPKDLWQYLGYGLYVGRKQGALANR